MEVLCHMTGCCISVQLSDPDQTILFNEAEVSDLQKYVILNPS